VTYTFITVLVEEHDALPEGCCMRFKAVSGPRVVSRVLLEGEGPASTNEWTVESCDEAGELGPALGVTVEDSSAGSSTLVYGGAHGLRLRPVGGGDPVAEPYLLLAERSVLE
jgi:hypothetical protein